jgi:hypothetical protein
MLKGIRRFAALILVGGAVSCDVSDPIAPEVDLIVQEESIEFGTDGDLVSLSLDIAIRNRSEGAVELAPCVMTIEREVGGTWSRVWAPACTLVLERTPVEPEQTITLSLAVQERRSGGLIEDWAPPFDGWYRVVARIEDPGTFAPAATVASARFCLTPPD